MGKIITENDLRSHPPAPGTRRYEVEEGTFVAESARSWLEKREIELVMVPRGTTSGTMSRTPVPDRGNRTYLDAATGLGLGREKPEEMTHLRGNLLVKKTHPRIAFRGKLDRLRRLFWRPRHWPTGTTSPASGTTWGRCWSTSGWSWGRR